MEKFLRKISLAIKKSFGGKSQEREGSGGYDSSLHAIEYARDASVRGHEEEFSKESCSCPLFAVKSIIGHRPNMEDSYAVVPDVIMVPQAWVHRLHDSCGPGSELKEATHGDNASSSSNGNPSSGRPVPVSKSESKGHTLTQGSVDKGGNHDIHSGPGGSGNMQRQTMHLFAVYDGHGGASVSDHCSKRLHEHLRTAVGSRLAPALHKRSKKKGSIDIPDLGLDCGSQSLHREPRLSTSSAAHTLMGDDCIRSSLFEAFIQVDKELLKKGQAKEKGTTAVVVLLGSLHLWVANCGDSRAVLARGGEEIALSSDHKASRPDEVIRVEQAGGYVWWNRVMGELAISRAIGDHKLRPFVIADPEVTRTLRQTEDQLLIVASDGLWDVFSNRDACAMALTRFQEELTGSGNVSTALKRAAAALAKAALSRGSRDNVTVLVIDVRRGQSSL